MAELFMLPITSNCTRAEWPSRLICPVWPGLYGDWTLETHPLPWTRLTTSSTAARKAGWPAVRVELWIRTCSVACYGKARLTVAAALPELPVPASDWLSLAVPIARPASTANITRSSQAPIDRHGWAALQRPSLAVKLVGVFMAVLLAVVVMTASWTVALMEL